MPTETHADCNKKYNLIYYTVKPGAVLTVCADWLLLYVTSCDILIGGRHAIIIGILAGSLSHREPARRLLYRVSTSLPTSFPGLPREDEGREEKALVWAGHVTTKYGYI